MASHKRINKTIQSNGAYSEIFYFDDDGNEADEKTATNCVVREYRANGELLCEIWGSCEE